mgnify:CR=1 FL=1
MLFQINSMWQLLGWVLVFAGLVILNEIERRTKLGGYGIFVGVLAILTVYFIAIQISAANGGWGATNDTYVWLVPLCKVICSSIWMHRFHVLKVQAVDR